MVIIAKNITSAVIQLSDLGLTIPSNTSIMLSDLCPLYSISSSNELLKRIATGSIIINNGSADLSISTAIDFLVKGNIEIRRPDGKLYVQESPRMLGTLTNFLGIGDDLSDPHKIGGGQRLINHHKIGDPAVQSFYMDYNIVNNRTILREGYINWKDAKFDTVTMQLVPKIVTYTTGTNTNYNLYGGYLVIPAAGNGTIDITSDLTLSTGGLVYIPIDENGKRVTSCFWNAEWDTTTKRYKNITPAPLGNGAYNIFVVEVSLGIFANSIPMIGNGCIHLSSSDSDDIGHGMRLKFILTTHIDGTDFPDHEWFWCGIMSLYRGKI